MKLDRFNEIAVNCFGYKDECKDITLLDVKRAETFVNARIGSCCDTSCTCTCTCTNDCEATPREQAIVYYVLVKETYSPEDSIQMVEKETLDYMKSLQGYTY